MRCPASYASMMDSFGWNFDTAIEKSVEWSKVYAAGGDVVACMDKEIEEFFA